MTLPDKQAAKVVELMSELDEMATNIRNDWSGFDGRDLRKAIDIWLKKLGIVLDIEYIAYYEAAGMKQYHDVMETNVAKMFGS